MMSAMKVVVKVPTIRASAPKLGGLFPAGLGIQRGLVKKCTQSSFGTIGAASLKIKRKMATIATMLLQPQTRISHSIGFSNKSRMRNLPLVPEGFGDSVGGFDWIGDSIVPTSVAVFLLDRKSTRLTSSHVSESRMPSS